MNDDVMRRLAAARPRCLEDGAVSAEARRAELDALMNTAPLVRETGHVRVPRRPRTGFARTVLVGTAAAVGLVMAVPLLQQPSHGRSESGSAAQFVLSAVAKVAAEQPVGHGRYWLRTSMSTSQWASAGYAKPFVAECAQRVSTAVDSEFKGTPDMARGGEAPQMVLFAKGLGCHGVTPRDTAAWQAAGAPDTFTVYDGLTNGEGKPLTVDRKMSDRSAQLAKMTGTITLGGGSSEAFLVAGAQLSLAQLRQLPDSPGALKSALLKKRPKGSARAQTDPYVFRAAMDLILSVPVTPEVRSAAFMVLSALDGVRVEKNVKDSRGREGTLVAMVIPESLGKSLDTGGRDEERLIFDPVTSRGLARETVVVKAGVRTRGFPEGNVYQSSTSLEAKWTDELPEEMQDR